jgi:AcrR family transcriptional regulator
MKRTFQRARQPEQKEQRRAHLLATARAQLDDGIELRELSLNALAREAGMAKANVYRYFESREALLVALLWDEWGLWYEGFVAAWKRGRRRPIDLDALVSMLARSLGGKPLLGVLTAAVPSVLEQNLSEEAIRTFKRDTLAFFAEIATFLESCCASLSAAAYAELLRDSAHAIMGLHPALHPAPTCARVIAAPEFQFFQRDYVDELERFMKALATDYANRAALAQQVK